MTWKWQLRVLGALWLVLCALIGVVAALDDIKRCKWDEHGFVRPGYADGRYRGRCDEFGRLVR